MSLILSHPQTSGYLYLSFFDKLPLCLATHPLIRNRILTPFRSLLSSLGKDLVPHVWVLVPTFLVPHNVETMLHMPVFVRGLLRIRTYDGTLLWDIDANEATFQAFEVSAKLPDSLIGQLSVWFGKDTQDPRPLPPLNPGIDAWVVEPLDWKTNQLW